MVLYMHGPLEGVLKYFFKPMSKVADYLKETREELKHVSWLSREQTIAYTVIVIGISIAIAAYLGLLDYVFSSILQHFI